MVGDDLPIARWPRCVLVIVNEGNWPAHNRNNASTNTPIIIIIVIIVVILAPTCTPERKDGVVDLSLHSNAAPSCRCGHRFS